MEMKSKLEAAQRSSADFREETKLKLERIGPNVCLFMCPLTLFAVADFASKEKEYHELIGSLKIQIDLEKQNCRKSTEEITGKVAWEGLQGVTSRCVCVSVFGMSTCV